MRAVCRPSAKSGPRYGKGQYGPLLPEASSCRPIAYPETSYQNAFFVRVCCPVLPDARVLFLREALSHAAENAGTGTGKLLFMLNRDSAGIFGHMAITLVFEEQEMILFEYWIRIFNH